MRRARSTIVLVGVAIALLLSSMLVIGGVAAQEETPEPETDAETNESEVVAEVDSQVRVSDYSYDHDDEIMSVTLDHVDPDGSSAQMTLTEVISSREGSSGSFGVETLSLRPGETATVHVSAKMIGDQAAVMIVSQESLEAGQGTFVRVGEEPTSIIEGDPTWGDVRAGGASGIGISIAVILLAGWHTVARKEIEYQEAEI